MEDVAQRRKVVGQHTLDETLSETDRINVNIREMSPVGLTRLTSCPRITAYSTTSMASRTPPG
jgi:regulator of protease activity HflC (stomatin/prohibitin superfamily)